MLSLLKNVLKGSLQKSKSNESSDHSSVSTDETIVENASSDFAGLWQAAEREAKLGNREEARRLCYLALEIEPNNPILLCQLAAIEREMELYEDARDNLLLAISSDENYIPAYQQIAIVYCDLKHFEESTEYLQKALESEPNNQYLLCDLGNIHAAQRKFSEALPFFEKAIDIAPEWGDAYNNLANCYLRMNEYEKAVEPLLIAQAFEVKRAELYINLNFFYYSTGRLARAYRYARKGLLKYPENDHIHWTICWSLLLYKRYQQGWLEYEYRFQQAGGVSRRHLNFPEWQGESLTDKTILIIAEQGLGDQLMFASCLPDLQKYASKCIVECDRKLLGLFENSFPEIDFINTQNKPNSKLLERISCNIDYYTHIGSLPRWYRNDLASFYPARQYLKAESQCVNFWHERLHQIGKGFKVGISWRGGVDKTRSHLRTIPLIDWEPILRIEGIHFINLQYGDCTEELEEVASSLGVKIHHWQEAIADYRETAGLISSLDLVLSVCTSVIHLAGGLGQKTWVLVPASPEWRYLAGDATLPWYRQVYLFRQQAALEWRPLLLEISEKLTALSNTSVSTN